MPEATSERMRVSGSLKRKDDGTHHTPSCSVLRIIFEMGARRPFASERSTSAMQGSVAWGS